MITNGSLTGQNNYNIWKIYWTVGVSEFGNRKEKNITSPIDWTSKNKKYTCLSLASGINILSYIVK